MPVFVAVGAEIEENADPYAYELVEANKDFGVIAIPGGRVASLVIFDELIREPIRDCRGYLRSYLDDEIKTAEKISAIVPKFFEVNVG